MKNKNHLRIQEAADILGVSTKTLRRWSASGKLVPARSHGNQRYYSREQLSVIPRVVSPSRTRGPRELDSQSSWE